MNNLSSGGAEKSLSSLLRIIDFSLYEVDLLLFKKDGIYFQDLPSQINIINEPPEYKYFDMPFKKAIKKSIGIGRMDIALSRIKASTIFRLEKNRARCEQRAWRYVGKSLKKLKKNYDVAIGFMEKSSIYYVVEKVNALKKIGWIHTNYKNSGMDKQIDFRYFNRLDYLVTVSDECAGSLKDTFKSLSSKVKIIQNIVSPQTIRLLASEETADIKCSDEVTNIVTVGRLGHEKGIDIAIESCRLLLDKGVKIKWQVIGYGTERELFELNKLIEENKLTGTFQLLGVKENPYPYIKHSDIYIQPSRYEGKSIAIDEAKILEKPIIVTNFPTAKDQIENNVNGLIVEMSPASICEAILLLINNIDKKNKLVNELSKVSLDTESEILKFYELCLP
ncbi:glycosyltransferase [Metabacillus idriensis]|uniref:glycosyltransferase n=1 Tax=Metabacillus idriensis TaxID=324768 RepID=UPI0017494496|nr:glycosyltransferase [Metabacillus idriensis]